MEEFCLCCPAATCCAAPLPLLPVFPTLSGCARQPPRRNNLSGRRIVVTLDFDPASIAFGGINPNFYYYFLINNSNKANAPGPVPVLFPPYGNGFASGPAGVQGFTDFVLIGSNSASP